LPVERAGIEAVVVGVVVAVVVGVVVAVVVASFEDVAVGIGATVPGEVGA